MSFELTQEEAKFLVKLARNAVETVVTKGKKLGMPKDVSPKFKELCGVFVTINTVEQDGGHKLRGCIGLPYPTNMLAEAVIESAMSAATRDPRFNPLTAKELDQVVLEVSVLTPPELVKVEKTPDYCSKIRIGRDGLIVKRGYYNGLLLPQVPLEWKWNEETFLCQCCIKAGLAPDSWLLGDTKIYKFSCIIAQETSPKGPIKVTDMSKG